MTLWFMEVSFKTMINGSYFGEIEVLVNQPRRSDAKCAINTELLSLERNKFLSILD